MTFYNFILGIGITLSIYGITSFCFPKKGKRKLRILFIFLFSILQGMNFQYNLTLFFLPLQMFLLFCLLKLTFHVNFSNLLFLGMALFLLCFPFVELFYITLYLFSIPIPTDSTLYIFSNILTLMTSFIFKEQLKNYFTQAQFFKTKPVILKYILANGVLIIILLLRLPKYEIPYFPFLFFFLIFFNMTLFLLKEKEKNRTLQQNLQKTMEYTEFTENLLMEYKSFLHEYKNKLIIIKSMVSSKNKELHAFIDSILEEKAINHFRWLMEIKSIPITGIKGLINFKLLKMKELDIDIEVYIAEEIATLKKDFLTSEEKNGLNTILGVLFDNAIEASLESNTKMASFQMYKEKDSVVILLANTFKSINIEQIEEKGFSTKGKNRGYGLSILNTVIKQNEKFKKETSIFENFFIQKISIMIPK